MTVVNGKAQIAPISVIIPALNAAQWIQEALASVREQSLSVAEVIVVDNGSTDATVQIATEAGATVLHEPTRGAAAARNAGIHAATQPWIALLDADDYWTPDKIETQWHVIQQFPDTRVLCTNYRFVGENVPTRPAFEEMGATYRKLPKTRLADGVKQISHTTLSAQLREGRHWFGLYPSSVLFQREDALAVGGFNPMFTALEDVEFFARLLKQTGDVVFIETPLAFYRWHAANTSLRTLLTAENHVKLRQAFIETPALYPDGAAEWARDTLPRWYRQLALAQLQRGESRNARTSLRESWRLNAHWRTAVLWLSTFVPRRSVS